MRALIVILVLANLGFAAWALLVDRPSTPPIARDISHLSHLVLASEPLPGAAPVATPAPAPAPVAAAAGRCQTIGPFNDLVLAAAASTQLQSRGFATTQREEAAADAVSYWVHLDDVPSEAAATRLLLMLRAIGLTDVHAMPTSSASEPRRISVGLFTEKDGADRRARQVKAGLGSSPVITEQHNAQASYWLDVTLTAPSQTVSTEGLLPASVKGGHIDVRDCPRPAGAPPT